MQRTFVFLAGLLLCFGLRPLGAQELDYEDTEARIDYAWFTEDANALRSLIQSIRATAQKTADTPEARYLTALAYYRLGSLVFSAKSADAATLMSRCVEDSGKVADAQPKSAEALALQAICYSRLGELQNWKSMVNLPLSSIKMEKALKLEPKNPRVALLDAVRDYNQANAGERAQSLGKFRRALELFEASYRAQVAPVTGTPMWGYADTYAYIGQCLKEKGDLLGARNAYERALIVAPDYAVVKRELQALLKN